MARKTLGLFEFLEECDLHQYYNSLRNNLRVQQVQQLKYLTEEDFRSIGMTSGEAKRLKASFNRHCPQNYASKLKKLLLPTSNNRKDEFLLEDDTVSSPEASAASISMPLPSPGEIKVPRQHIISPDAISVHKELGTGEFGVVQQGVWLESEVAHQVAIKSLSKERMQHSTFEFMKEYEIMQAINHQHIVRLHGVVLESSKIMIITELAPLRSLLECLKEPSLRPTLTVPRLATFARQICEGMKYLESKRLIHRDLAARNILVFSQHLVKVSDFGLSRALGVGKDYYQTNFNANLKLPIAWCAPECITFLKFTSASDVWAFGVTLWEMFSYGFQPWAAHNGQQILEAIDEPNCQRLDIPVHCPRDYYSVMMQCWHHETHARPTFDHLRSLLEDAHPEQVRTVFSSRALGQLEFDVGQIITVLDKHVSSTLWKGTLDDTGRVGLFSPSQTVTHIESLPDTSIIYDAKKSNKKRLSRDMISGPTGPVEHAGHIGLDGAHFGHIGFMGVGVGSGGRGGSSSLSRANSESSELAPLITRRNNRMGHTIGYLREKSAGDQQQQTNPTKHEYQSISDDEELFKPLDLGPSLLDEVFSELDSSDKIEPITTSKVEDIPASSTSVDVAAATAAAEHHGVKTNLKELVSSTLNMRRSKKKQWATVRPIKASDEKTLESAIAMANALASKSMHDLDKRSMVDTFYENSPGRSPLTPNSPSKKFSFWFPSSGGANKSPKTERRPFSEEANASSDLQSGLSSQEKDAYAALIESMPPLVTPVDKLGSQSIACLPHYYGDVTPTSPTSPSSSSSAGATANPPPLPPKSQTLHTQPKRHVRKNPLIVPSMMVSNLIRNQPHVDLQVSDNAHIIQKRRTSVPDEHLHEHFDDFESTIAKNIDALDEIGESALEPAFFHSDLNDDNFRYEGRQGLDSDEVRIMMKVMGRGVEADECMSALDRTGWNIHHAIKLVKLKKLIKAKFISDNEMLRNLENEAWDVAKAAGNIMKTM